MEAVKRGDAGFIAGVCIFAATMVLLYLSSTLYYALPAGKAERVFRGAWGWTLLVLVWGLAFAGVALKALERMSHPVISTSLYVFMGWLILIAANPMFERVPVSGLLWLVAGGVAYTAGVAFFVADARLRYGHFVWHLFVMAGTICHYFAVFWYAA